MQIEVMDIKDIEIVIPLYIDYYNNYEDGCWTEETARRRIKQVLSIDDSYSLLMKDDAGEVCGFVMGYGSALLAELEARVKEAGASCVELQAVKDEMHERYYGRAGYRDAKNFVLKVKWFE